MNRKPEFNVTRRKTVANGWIAAVAAVVLGAPAVASAQPGSGATPITLADAIRDSIAHSTQIKEAQANYLVARARTGQNASRQLPQLGFSVNASQFDDRTTVTLPGSTTPFELAPNNQEALTIAITQDLDVSGQLGLIVSQARLNARSAEYEVQAVSADQKLATTLAYYAVLRAEQNVLVAQADLEAYKQQQTTTTRLYTGGVGQRIDVYRADSQVAEAESEVVRRQNELNSARSTLNDTLGRPLDQPLKLVDPTLSGQVDLGDGATESTRPQLIAKALTRRPEALEATVEVLAANKGIQVAQRSSSPGLSLSLSGTHNPTTSFEAPREDVGTLTLSLSIPIFDGGFAREKVNEARSLVNSAKAREDRIRRDIALQVQNAALDVETARKREIAARAELEAAIAARKLAQQRFESQVGLYIEVTDAQSALTAAQAAKVQATYDLLTARAQLAHALNDPLDK